MANSTLPKRLINESRNMSQSGKYKSVNLIEEEKTLFITLFDDREIKIVVKSNYPFSPPLIFHEGKYINQKVLNFSPTQTLDYYLENFDNYPLVEYREFSFPHDLYSTFKKSNNRYLKLVVNGENIPELNEIYIDLDNPVVTDGKALFDSVVNICNRNGCVLKFIAKSSGIKITDLTDEIIESLKLDENATLIVGIVKIKTVDEFVDDLQKHSDISKISKTKPVATNHSGYEPSKFMTSWNLFNVLQQEIILMKMSQILSGINDSIINFNIRVNHNSSSSNIMIYYSEDHLKKLSDLFEHGSLEKSLDMISNIVTVKEDLDFIFIAFGDIDVSGHQKFESLTDNGKRIYTEYINT